MMKKLILALMILVSSSVLISCNDSFNEEFSELSSESTDPAGGGTGGGVSDPDDPE